MRAIASRGPRVADDAHRRAPQTLDRHGGSEAVVRSERGGRCRRPGLRSRSLDEQAVFVEEAERQLDRRPRRLPDPRDDLVDRSSAVEQRQERRQQEPYRPAFEDDDRASVFEQEPVAVLDEAVPGSQQGPDRSVLAQSSPPLPTRAPQQQLLLQQTISIANEELLRPLTSTVRSRSSPVNCSYIDRLLLSI